MEIDVQKFIVTAEDGSVSIDKDGLTGEMQRFIDSQVSKGVESFKKTYQKPDEKYEKQIRELTHKYNRSECKNILPADLYSEKERELLLDRFVGDDLAKSQETLTALVKERQTLDESRKQKLIETLKAGQPAPKQKPVGEEPKQNKPSFRERAEEIKKYYSK